MAGPGTNLAYDTATLVAVIPNLKLAQTWALDRFFRNIVEADTEYVAIDVDIGKRRMSPFVSPLNEGKLVEQRRYQTEVIKPAYIKDKRAPDLRKPVRRMIGERLAGAMTGAEREMANLEFELTDQIDMLDRRLEWMALQDLQFGSVTIAGEGFQTSVVDFGRDSSLTVTLTGNNRWGIAANFNAMGKDPIPTKTIETWQATILKKSGAVCSDIVFTTTPWELFLNADLAEGAIQYPRLGSFGNSIDPGPSIARGAVYKGNWGQYALWLYNDWYVDSTNTEQPMLPDGTVMLAGPDLMGLRAFGQILDPAFNYGPMAFAPKTWVQEDPGQRLIMMQSSPIIVPGRPNASLAATVI